MIKLHYQAKDSPSRPNYVAEENDGYRADEEFTVEIPLDNGDSLVLHLGWETIMAIADRLIDLAITDPL